MNTFRDGALAAVELLKTLTASASDADNCGNGAADFFAWRRADAAALTDGLGPMPEYLRGAISALAEYIHFSATTGEPDLDHWRSVAAMTEADLQREIDQLEADLAEAAAEDDKAGIGKSNVVQLHH